MNSQELASLFPELRGKALTLSPLEGGLTNRNFRVEADGEAYVLRVSGEDTSKLGIDRHCEAACSRSAAELDIGPQIVACLPERGLMLRRFLRGRVLTPADFLDADVISRVVKALHRYHTNAPAVGRFSPFSTVRAYHVQADERGVKLPELLADALDVMVGIERQMRDAETLRPCHNDLLAANFIDDGATVRIIDWEYAGAGDPFFDLGNLAVNNEFTAEQEQVLLANYFGEARTEDLRRLQLMRMASDLRESMWGFVQSATSSLDTDFTAYGQRHLERFVEAATAAGVRPVR